MGGFGVPSPLLPSPPRMPGRGEEREEQKEEEQKGMETGARG